MSKLYLRQAVVAFAAISLGAADLPPVARVGVSVTTKKLTLASAIEMALASNLDIEIERTNLDKADQAIRAAKGAFDPTFRFNPGYASNNTPSGSVLQGAGGKLTEKNSVENFYYREKTPWYGSSLGLDFENGRSSTSNLFSSLNPFYNTRMLVSFSLPLLRGRAIDRERAEIQVRSKQRDVSAKTFEIRVIDIVTRVQQAYWDLVAAREDVQVQGDAVDLAAQQLGMNQRMINSGTLAPIETVEVGGMVMPMVISADKRMLHAALRSQPYRVASFAMTELVDSSDVVSGSTFATVFFSTNDRADAEAANRPRTSAPVAAKRSGRCPLSPDFWNSRTTLNGGSKQRAPRSGLSSLPTR